ncbi:MAG TPA: M17 family peptidase N-terminal domain-containing protein, partial [Hyphomicrobium sp.]|nr:M17 family peptidase N-terminal domain-containing protein [Hyphomicrobium sp.]
MTAPLEISFARLDAAPASTLAVLAGQELAFSPTVQSLNTKAQGLLLKAAEAASFKGKQKSAIEILAPQKLDCQRVVLLGAGNAAEHSDSDWATLGGYALGQITARKTTEASLVAEVAGAGVKPDVLAANLAFGALLRHYTFKKYKKKGES